MQKNKIKLDEAVHFVDVDYFFVWCKFDGKYKRK
jgi:hypothetical protein